MHRGDIEVRAALREADDGETVLRQHTEAQRHEFERDPLQLRQVLLGIRKQLAAGFRARVVVGGGTEVHTGHDSAVEVLLDIDARAEHHAVQDAVGHLPLGEQRQVFGGAGPAEEGHAVRVHAEAGVDYTRTEQDGTVTNQVTGDLAASGYGVNVSAGGEWTNTVDAQGNVTDTVSGHVEGSGYGIDAHASGEYEHVQGADGSERTSISGEGGVSGYGLGIEGGGSYTETTDAQGNTTSSSDGWVDLDGLDTQQLMDLGSQALGAATGALSAGGGANPLDMIGDLASSSDLSDVLGQLGGEGGDPLAAVNDLLGSGQLDEFTSGLVGSEVAETAADQVWDDIGG